MSSRGGGSGFLGFILILVVIAVVVEIVKMVLALVGIALMVAVALVVLALAIYGLGRFSDDFGNRRAVVLKCIVPLCIIGVAVLLGGPKLLSLFQTETGMLWWHRTETHYLKLVLLVLFVTPVVFGFGYALADRFGFSGRGTVIQLIDHRSKGVEDA